MKSSRQLYKELEQIQARRRECEKAYYYKNDAFNQFNQSMSPSVAVIKTQRKEARIQLLIKQLNQELSFSNKHAEIVDAE